MELSSWRVGRLLLVLGAAASLAACGALQRVDSINNTLQRSVDSIDRAITALSQQSSDWRIVVQDLQQNVTADMQSTIRAEVTDLTRAAVLTGGAELRCNAEFMRINLERTLSRLRNQLVSDLNAGVDELAGLFGKPTKTRQPVEAPPPEPFICSMTPSAVDLTLAAERRSKIDIYGFDLRSKPIEVSVISRGNLLPHARRPNTAALIGEMRALGPQVGSSRIVGNSFEIQTPTLRLRRDVSSALSIVSDFHAVLDLTESGFELLPNAQEIVLSWDHKIQSEIAVLTHVSVLQCEVVDRPFNEAGTMQQTFIPPAVTENWYGKKPDRDFDGGGPCINFNLRLSMDAERRSVTASYFMDAWECKGDFGRIRPDYTEAVGSGSLRLLTVADDEKIISFDVDGYMEDTFFDSDHQPNAKYFSGTKPVTQLTYVGDTDGDEAGSRTGVTMVFRRIVVKVERCSVK